MKLILSLWMSHSGFHESNTNQILQFLEPLIIASSAYSAENGKGTMPEDNYSNALELLADMCTITTHLIAI